MVMEKKKIPIALKKNLPQVKVNALNEPIKGMDKIYDEKLKETINFVKSKNLIKLNSNINFEDYKEAENYFKEELGAFLNGKYSEVHEKVSEIRKIGREATVLTFKLMMIPLKIKIFLATCEKKDFEKVLNMISEIEREISKWELK
jgi:hypothetical protein